MSTNLACFLFGVPATGLWILSLARGTTYASNTRWVRRSDDPFRYWLFTILWGSVALGLLVAPVLAWLGLRE